MYIIMIYRRISSKLLLFLKNAVYLSFPSNYLDESKILSIFATKNNDDRKGQVL
jgi:hypothetical protein